MFCKQTEIFMKTILKSDFPYLACFTRKFVLGMYGHLGHVFREISTTAWYFRARCQMLYFQWRVRKLSLIELSQD